MPLVGLLVDLPMRIVSVQHKTNGNRNLPILSKAIAPSARKYKPEATMLHSRRESVCQLSMSTARVISRP